MLGSWNYDDVKVCNLPQKAQSAFTEVTSSLVGADYEPIAYLGSQTVSGTNYGVLALQKSVTATPETRLMKLIINRDTEGKSSLVSVSVIPM